MLSLKRPIDNFMGNIIKTIRNNLQDGRGIENDTGLFKSSLRKTARKFTGEIAGIGYSKFLRSNRDFDARRRRSSATHNGFLNMSIDDTDKKYGDKFMEEIADEMMKELNK